VPEVIKVAAYRHRYFGTPFHVLVQDLMRGPSSWTVGERELFAAFTSSRNQCQFCTATHQAFAASFTSDDLGAAALAAPAAVPARPQVAAVLTSKDELWTSPAGSSWEGLPVAADHPLALPWPLHRSENGTGLGWRLRPSGSPGEPDDAIVRTDLEQLAATSQWQ
jgi:AhpD family alkylhydroperoxidase